MLTCRTGAQFCPGWSCSPSARPCPPTPSRWAVTPRHPARVRSGTSRKASAASCGTCTLCIRSCPTGAITEPYVVDARRCLSYLTIEQKGRIPKEFQRALGNRIFGCDDCLDVCPYNHQATPTAEPAFRATPFTLNPNLDLLARQTAAEFQAAFRRSAVRRATQEGLQRSIAIAQKNVS